MPNVLLLFITFFKIGLFTFGGGYAMIPLIQREIVQHGWMSELELVNFIAVSESTPGPFAINVATFVGNLTSGIPGGLAATIGVIAPSWIIVLLIARNYDTFKENKYVKYVLRGLRPAVVGLIAAAAVSIGESSLLDWNASVTALPDLPSVVNWGAAGIFLVLFLAEKKWKLHPILLIVIAAGLGLVVFGGPSLVV